MQLLRKLAHSTGKAILLSTHDMDLALRSADRIWLLPKGGHLQVGGPEDLVLNGTFEQAFTSEGVFFNRFSGSFQMQQTSEQPVQLIGVGEAAAWARKALEREGFAIQESASLKIEVLAENGQLKWMADDGVESLEFGSVYELMAGIRHKIEAADFN